MDRRVFLKTGLLAAGAAFGSGLVGCTSRAFSIPCLGPAAPPTPVSGMKYLRASEIGCALDCDLANGRNKHTGGAATDDAPLINAAMAAASADNPITLIIDGSALISGLFLPAGGNWNIAGLGCGTGFFVKTGTNNDGIHNGAPNAAIPFDPGTVAPNRGANVSLSNFTLNGNQGDGQNGDSTGGIRQGSKVAFFCGINLMSLNNINIENVVIVNTPSYHIRFSNVGRVSVSGCVMESYGLSTDGLHFDGPSNDITISNCNFTTGDDSIALNCPEGYGGDISRVKVSSCAFNSLSLMRLYTTNGPTKFNINSVSVSSCNGKLTEGAFLIGTTGGSNPNSVSGVSISDCTVSAPTVLALAENFGDITMRNVNFTPWPSRVAWVAPQASRSCAFVRPSPLYGNVRISGGSLSFENCGMGIYGDVSSGVVILENDSTIDNVIFNGFRVVQGGPTSPLPGLVNIGSGSIGQLVLDAVDTTDIVAPTANDAFSNIGSVAGTGVLASGWEFPDSVMANGVPYISSSTGLPTIKVNGAAKPFPT